MLKNKDFVTITMVNVPLSRKRDPYNFYIYNLQPYRMKKYLYLAFVFLIISCGSLSKTYNSGSLLTEYYKEVLPFNYDNNLAIIEVVINSKKYNFLVDTGAPTVISSSIYKDINVKPAHQISVSDSQGQKDKKEVVIVPEIKLGNLTYNNIGAVVASLDDVFEFKCMKIDGIIGANQMAKSFWKFDYQNHEITITEQLSNYELSSYKDTLSFTTSMQKTPYVKGTINGLTTSFTYDTGFTGHIDVSKKLADFPDALGITRLGNSSVGLYDAIDSVSTRTVKMDSVKIGAIDMKTQIVDLDHGSLIGNKFMNKHEVIMDWSSQKIYLKKVKEYQDIQETSFGFNFRIKDNKAIVTGLIKEFPNELELGDQLLSINDFDFRDINKDNACEKWNNYNITELDTVNITYQRDSVEYKITLLRKELFK